MNAAQIGLILFAAFAFSRAVRSFRRGGLTVVQLLLWVVFWAGVIFVVVQPDTTSVVARWLGIGRGVDAVIYSALAVVFYLLFRMFGKVEDLERQITRLVRAAALKELDDGPDVDRRRQL